MSVSTIALGDSATASANDAIAIGVNSSASGSATSSIAIGNSAVSTGANSISVGPSSTTNATLQSIAIGNSGTATTFNNDVAIGSNAQAGGSSNGNCVAIGNTASAITFDNNIALGTSATASGASVGSAIAVGSNADATGDYSIALGTSTTSSGTSSTTIGTNITNAQANTTVLADGSLNFALAGSASNECIMAFQNGLELVGYSSVNSGFTNYAAGVSSNSPTLRILQNQASTTDGTTPVASLIIPLQSNSTVGVRGYLVGTRIPGSTGGSAGDSWYFEFGTKAKNISGTATFLPLNKTLYFDAGVSPNNISLQNNSGNLEIDIIGATNENITWNITVLLNELVNG